MKLLIITQVIDTEHPILGFFHRWVEEFAKHCEQVHVIALQVGTYNLPDNVTVHSLGKEQGREKFSYLFNFYKLIWSLRHDYDNVFVHMNQIYVILGAPFWRVWGKKVGLWYVHRQVSISLRAATLIVYKIFTSAPESFGIKTKKVSYVGHGIDFAMYEMVKKGQKNDSFTLSHFGRISRIKNIDVLFYAVSLLSQKEQITIRLYGESVTENDITYKTELQNMVNELGIKVDFCGSIPGREIPLKLSETDISVNLSPTGGWDKVVLEAIASRTTVLVSNTSYSELFGDYGNQVLFTVRSPKDLAEKISNQLNNSQVQIKEQTEYLYKRAKVYDIGNLVQKLVKM